MTRIVPWITREVTPSPTMQAHNCEWSKEQYEPYQDEVPCTSSLTEINNRDKNKINQIIHKQLIRDTQKKKQSQSRKRTRWQRRKWKLHQRQKTTPVLEPSILFHHANVRGLSSTEDFQDVHTVMA